MRLLLLLSLFAAIHAADDVAAMLAEARDLVARLEMYQEAAGIRRRLQELAGAGAGTGYDTSPGSFSPDFPSGSSQPAEYPAGYPAATPSAEAPVAGANMDGNTAGVAPTATAGTDFSQPGVYPSDALATPTPLDSNLQPEPAANSPGLSDLSAVPPPVPAVPTYPATESTGPPATPFAMPTLAPSTSMTFSTIAATTAAVQVPTQPATTSTTTVAGAIASSTSKETPPSTTPSTSLVSTTASTASTAASTSASPSTTTLATTATTLSTTPTAALTTTATTALTTSLATSSTSSTSNSSNTSSNATEVHEPPALVGFPHASPTSGSEGKAGGLLGTMPEEPKHAAAADLDPLQEEESDEEEEEEEFTAVDVGCSWTLLGSLFFTMILFYFLNYPDEDIKRYTWSIINTTLSIFTAVLSFQGLDQLVREMLVNPILRSSPQNIRSVALASAGTIMFIMWYCFALVAIALAAGIRHEERDVGKRTRWVITDFMRADHGQPIEGDRGQPIKGRQLVQGCRRKGIAEIEGVEVFVASRAVSKEYYETRTKCWSTLFAHMAGFAMISAGGDLQNAPPFRDSAAMSWVAVLLCILFLVGLFSLAGFLYKRDQPGSEAQELFVDEAVEAEDDVFCLAGSFLLVQSTRFTITGALPSKMGTYHMQDMEAHQTIGLYCMAVILAVLMVMFALVLPKRRAKSLAVGTASMGFAWCLLFATRSLFDSSKLLIKHDISPITIEGRILLAMMLSLFACGVIVVLDRIEDGLREEGDELHKVLKHVITGLSILIGFTWEHTFDGCVEAISSLFTHDVLLIKLLLTILIVSVVLPAWRMYILAKVIHMEHARREQREALGHSRSQESSSEEEEASAKLLAGLC